MKPVDPQIIELLNEFLTNELTATNQYWIHARMCHNWGFERLWEKIRAEAIDEMKHADSLIERILYLEGVPNLQRLNKIKVGETVKEQLELDLELEKAAIKRLNEMLQVCRKAGDNGTWDLFKHILVSEEEHADWLECQLEQIELVGIKNYLAQQIRS